MLLQTRQSHGPYLSDGPTGRPIPLLQVARGLGPIHESELRPCLDLCFFCRLSCILRVHLLHFSPCSERPVSLILWFFRQASESDAGSADLASLMDLYYRSIIVSIIPVDSLEAECLEVFGKPGATSLAVSPRAPPLLKVYLFLS